MHDREISVLKIAPPPPPQKNRSQQIVLYDLKPASWSKVVR